VHVVDPISVEYLRVYGDTVIVAGSESAVWGARPVKLSISASQVSGIWIEQAGRRQEVARHANIVPEQ
jgi:hypothetical protein